MDRHLGRVAVDGGGGRRNQTARTAAERNGRDFLDPGERDQHQRDQQQDAETKREGGAGHEVVSVPEREHDGAPGADHIGRDRERERFAEGRLRLGQDRQREQQPEQQREAGDLPVIGIADRSGQHELRVARGVEQTPIGADAAFEGFEGLIDRLDDVVVDAVGFGARQEIADHQRLLDPAGDGALVVVAGARPAELGDHDALAGIGAADLIVDIDGVVDRLIDRQLVPVGQDVDGDEVDGGRQLDRILDLLPGLLRILVPAEPDVPGFTGGDRHRARSLHALDDLRSAPRRTCPGAAGFRCRPRSH